MPGFAVPIPTLPRKYSAPLAKVALFSVPSLAASKLIGNCTLVIAVPAQVTEESTTAVVALVQLTIYLVRLLLISVVPRIGLVAL
jgi:hypothetical protein